jgi:dihydroorotate dehydrogenase
VDTIYRKVLLPPVRALTRDDAEVAHDLFLRIMGMLQRRPPLQRMLLRRGTIEDPRLDQSLMDGIHFANPFVTAAGMDKNGTIHQALAALTGVGAVELGGVTKVPQPGNPRPRIVRVGKDNLINSMGFPSAGVDVLAANVVAAGPCSVPLGVQVAKNKGTADLDAPAEYAAVIDRLRERGVDRFVDYLTINVSSPNTPGLRALQTPELLGVVMEATTEAVDRWGDRWTNPRRRLLVKLAPDLGEAAIEAAIQQVLERGAGGVILTNTTTARPVSGRNDDRPGGFSGSALYGRSSRLVRFAAGLVPKDRLLVATGGIDSVDRAYEMLRHADLVGGYTGLVLRGPNLFRRLAAGVVERMVQDGISSLEELRAGQRPAGHRDPHE